MSEFTTGSSFGHMRARESAGSVAIDAISLIIGDMIDGIVRRRQRARTRRELLALDDHMLEDIGLSRMDFRGGRFAELNRMNWSGRGHPSGM
jgi:uncharacterized protein YjiS (DUF1127 family)